MVVINPDDDNFLKLLHIFKKNKPSSVQTENDFINFIEETYDCEIEISRDTTSFAGVIISRIRIDKGTLVFLLLGDEDR